ncbi:MAG TPA: FecR domain-containing protein [Candidatus Acidoferrum sp.]|nr:FecR domain-containing protein [Candidatus Acidoferrum sp.]
MKQTRSLINNLIAGAVALAMVSTLAAQNVREGAATVARIKGPARYTTGNNVWQPLKVGVVLKPGTIVQTSTQKGSFVDVVLSGGSASVPQPAIYKPSIPSSMSSSMAYQPRAEQNVVRIWENSALGIDKLASQETGMERVTDTQLDLKTGHISGSVKKMSAASKYEVKLPNGVAGIRGTLYDIFAEGIIKVRVGSVVLAWVDPKTGNVVTQVVSGGQGYDARTGVISPLSPSDMSSLDALSAGLLVVGTEAPLILTRDRTLEPVSPLGPVGAGPNPPGTPPD